MATAVSVLCPNGRRQNVKLSPNTKLLQILEEACRKQGLVVEEHELRHGRNVLDLTMPVRYSNLPNNAKLEVVRSIKIRTETSVVIALQLENGKRFQHEFEPSSTLYNILEHFGKNGDSDLFRCTKMNPENSQVMHAVIVYMREEVAGEVALRNTTLRKLGLTSGNCILRLVYRVLNESTLSEINEQIYQHEAKRQKMGSPSKVPTQNQGGVETISSLQLKATDEEGGSTHSPCVPLVSENVAKTPAGNTAEASPELPVTAQSLPQSLSHFQRSVFPPSAPTDPKAGQYRDVYPVLPQARSHFADFKFPEDTKGKCVYQNELSEVKEEEYRPCGRESMVYSLVDLHSEAMGLATNDEDISDEFFEVTETDLRKMMIDLQNKVRLANEQPLMTQAMRQQQLEDKMSKYSHAIIRVQFPDKKILQGVFRPRETVRALYKYVQSCLADSSMPFYLYTTPPKKELDDQAQLLFQANLVPAVLVYFGCHCARDQYLAPCMLEGMKTIAEAEKVVKSYLFKSATQENETDNISAIPERSASCKTQSDVQPSSSASGSGKVPKWFKIGKK